MYRRFARVEAHGKSPLYEELCEGVASDPDMLSFLLRQRADKRQPNLLLTAIRLLFGTQLDYSAFRTVVPEPDYRFAWKAAVSGEILRGRVGGRTGRYR
jgi:hypothetical protein